MTRNPLSQPQIRPADPPEVPASSLAELTGAFLAVRQATEELCRPLVPEDYVIQTMQDVSPAKWHLAHTTWFFEQFLLVDGPQIVADYEVFHPQFKYLFNSYYVTVGDRHCRNKRGMISRPTVAEVFDYRRHVDAYILTLLRRCPAGRADRVAELMTTGLHHEQQHQELLLTDIKHVFSCNPLYPAYRPAEDPSPAAGRSAGLVGRHDAFHEEYPFGYVDGGVVEVGHDGPGFSYDNERPRHRVFLEAYRIGRRLVTNGEFLEFVEAGGYRQPHLWLSMGAAAVAADPANWSHPYYWHRADDGRWHEFTLRGLTGLDLLAPVCHLSYFEADAYARWRGGRLPTEAEWEHACVEAGHEPASGNFVENGHFHPRPPADAADGQMFGDVWEWTSSGYAPYPGYRAPDGALGEYNGKFMCNQYVLRGGSVATPRSHVRATYRNFFPPDARWQFTGVRLAEDA